VALDLYAVLDIHLVCDHIAPLHDVQTQFAVLFGLLDQHTAVLRAHLSEAIEERSVVGMLHPVAVLERKDERLRVAVCGFARDLDVFGVDISRADGNVHAEFADVVERLLALQTVETAGRELTVVIQLDRAECLILRVFVAVSDFDRVGAILSPLLFYEVKNGVHTTCVQIIARSPVVMRKGCCKSATPT
jgi:hypothetical protein